MSTEKVRETKKIVPKKRPCDRRSPVTTKRWWAQIATIAAEAAKIANTVAETITVEIVADMVKVRNLISPLLVAMRLQF